MTADRDRLFALLPAVYRNRDVAEGEPLRALLQVIAEQVNLVEEDLDRAYDNWFIETCDDWVIPYIGDLIGYEPVGGLGETAQRTGALISRREVANTIGYRAQKGTRSLLERLAADVAGWPAVAVEFRDRLAQSQSLRMLRPARGRMAGTGVRTVAPGRPSDLDARFPDMRRLSAPRGAGRHGLLNVGLYVWRLRAFSVTDTPARCCEDIGPNCFTFSILGNDAPLFSGATPPETIGRRAFSAPRARGARFATASPAVYGEWGEGGEAASHSVAIRASRWPDPRVKQPRPVPADKVIVADLEDWTYLPPSGFIAVDPERGRISFPPRQVPKGQVTVSYHYGFSAEIGGGEYTRLLSQEYANPDVPGDEVKLIRVAGVDQLRDALKPWSEPWDEDEDPSGQVGKPPRHEVIEITDSGAYVLPIRLWLRPGSTLQIRAAQRKRPVLSLIDWRVGQADNLTVTGKPGSRLTIDGLLIFGRGIQIEGALRSFTLRHSTLVPGWTLDPDCDPRRPAEPSIELIDSGACVTIEHSIVGSIQVNNDEVWTEPVPIRVSDSIIDATGADCDSPQCEALGAAGSLLAFASAQFVRSTVIGRVMTHAIELGENSIFLGRVTVARRHLGCLRFCYVLPGSRTPRRFQCQPDLVEQAAVRLAKEEPDNPAQRDPAHERARVHPRFDSLRYGKAAYCRLAPGCAEEIARGAEDESEMGAFHDLHNARRAANLRARLDEYVPARCHAGIIFAD